MEHSGQYLFVLVVAAGVLSQWLAWRFRFPAIILLSIAGILLGPVAGVIHPSEDFGEGLRTIISLGVAVILFEGGLNLRSFELKEAAAGVQRLVTAAVAFNFLFATLAAHLIGGISLPVSLVMGAILVVTGPTVIMPLLRQAMLNRRTASYLKWEAIINDPIGALLAVLVFQYFAYSSRGEGLVDIFQSLGAALLVAAALGAGGAYLLVQAFRRAWVPEFLKAPTVLAFVFAGFAMANAVQAEAGLLTVTVMGMVIANLGLPSFDEMRRFKEYITVLLVSVVFILLTADLDPSILNRLDWHAALFVVVLLFVVRPLAVQLATVGSAMNWRDRLLVGWIGPRGIVAAAVAGVFGPDLVDAGYPDGELLLPVIFAVIFATVVLHGLSLGWLARRLGLSASGPRNGVLIVGASPWTTELGRVLKDLGIRTLIVDNSWHRLRQARLAGVPVYFAEILSEQALESIELHDIGQILAATSNDAYNALVCSNFAPDLGWERVFQLPMGDGEKGQRRRIAQDVRGRVAFGQEALYEELWRRHSAGWKFQKTRLTETFSYEDYRKKRSTNDIEVLRIAEDGALTMNSIQRPIQPKIGDTIVTFTSAKGDASKPAAKPGSMPPKPALPE
ncbi:MAG: sodium:proton antiporter [Pseudomonadota bacterium]|nr:sodium:proton antiporter [Pseudomonadota bacterium]